MTNDLRVVGRSVERNDGVGFVTGRTRYTGDLAFPRMLHLKMVRSPLHHARIRGVDLSEAERVPGFVRAITHADVPHNVYTILGLIGVEPEEEFVLPVDRVRYKGEPIVAILAETEAAAYEAVARVRLDLDELPAVFDMDEALAPGAPIVTHWGNNTFMYEGHECRRVRYGDVEAGFAMADHIVEGEYRTGPIEHAPLETTGAVAVPEANGRYTVYTNTQAVYFSLDNTSIILQSAGEPAALHRRHRGRRVRRQGGRDRGAAGDAGRDAHRSPGALRLQPLRGDAGQLHAQPRDHPDQGRRDGGRDDRRPQGHRLHGLRRVQPPDAVRGHQVRRQRRRSVPDPERVDRRLLHLHQPDADVGDARLRGHHGHVRGRGPDGQDREAVRAGPVDRPVPQRAPQRGHQAAPQGDRGRHADRDHAGRGGAGGPRAAPGPRRDDVGAARRAGTCRDRKGAASHGDAARHRHGGRRTIPPA